MSTSESRSFGICVGAANIKAVVLVETVDGVHVERKVIRSHESNPRKTFTKLIQDLDIDNYDFGVLTGRKFRTIVNAPSITEPEALEMALSFMKQANGERTGYRAIASLGAENFIVYRLSNEGTILTIETGNKCASGTGEFLLQQIGRMNISIDEAVRFARNSEIFKVSGRCSVFCKTDCTHALNKGIPIGRVTAGLCQMIADKVLNLLEKTGKQDIIAVGGVTLNSVIVDLLRQKIHNLTVPEHADVFEALGAAYYALVNRISWKSDIRTIFKDKKVSFDFLPPINEASHLVRFEKTGSGTARNGDECIVGLDVGSTTTKAVVIRTSDNAVLASVYLRTNGNPVKASRECYHELGKQIDAPVTIVGLGTTGSGRRIAGLHASTDAIINEIIAHATGAAYFDKEVDTIFEIGGQDAKYTYLINGVPSDYAMNEACSAGTGSFLEESAKESLGIDFREIEPIALTGTKPPNFNDQCAAFISSDIKTAIHEGISKKDIVAGLVYSIGMNYVNRVKGQRAVGKKVFMQGGVCYNKAVPLAMANLTGKEIIVPPDPGLIGAFGVALEVKDRIRRGILERRLFDIKDLADREMVYGKPFICKGGIEKCDRKCEIALIITNGKKIPFGGACNKYYNIAHHVSYDTSRNNYVQVRQDLVFKTFATSDIPEGTKRVGILRSYLTNMLYPLFYHFFRGLGLKVILSDNVDVDGIKRTRTSLCFPGEISHGCFSNLLKKELDFIFIPKLIELYVENSISRRREHQSTCLLLQSEPYCLKSAFKGISFDAQILSPTIDFSQGLNSQENVFAALAKRVGQTSRAAARAYHFAVQKQHELTHKLKEIGKSVLADLEKDPKKFAIVLFGRPYNAFAREANLGIPAKFASRGILIIPWDFLPFENEVCKDDICWAMGQNLMKAASFVYRHPQLFGAYITNFSCGPDSFLVGYFRDIMKTKPSLTLELDSHTADAGVNTRIEAFLDIINKYLQLEKKAVAHPSFQTAWIAMEKKNLVFHTSDNHYHSIYDKRMHLLIPSMGRLSSELMAAVFSGTGIRTSAIPVYNVEDLKLGRGNTSCKECLPLQLMAGGLLKYLKYRENDNELLAYFMPTCGGNCRFTQYNVFLRKLIEKNRLHNVAFMTLTNENGYAGLSTKATLNILKAFIISDVMEDIKNALMVLSDDRQAAKQVFELQWKRIKDLFIYNNGSGIYKLLEQVAASLARIPLRYPLSEARVISLLGEIFIRRDDFSTQGLLERLARKDIIVRRAHISEWLTYCDYNVKHGIYESEFNLKENTEFTIKMLLQRQYERRIKKILAKSGLYHRDLIDMKTILKYGKNFFDIRFTGEPLLVAGNFFKEVPDLVHGAISIGPFACMPTRVIEAVMSVESTMETKIALHRNNNKYHDKGIGLSHLPFLSIEADGNPFPQVLEARIEAFALQVDRLHQEMCS